MRLKSILMAGTFVVLSACGGGGGGNSMSSTGGAAVAEACGPTAPVVPVSSAANVQPIQVNTSLANSNIINTLMMTVTVCNPISNACVSIPNVQVDTGSTGLRLIHSKLATLGLTPIIDGAANPIGECLPFADGFVWGGIASAYVKFTNGAVTSSMTIQMIDDDSSQPTPPGPLASMGLAGCNTMLEDTPGGIPNVQSPLGVNGIIGVGLFNQDCGPACAGGALDQTYYDCPAGATNSGTTTSCTPISMSLAAQVSNPVWLLPTNNNGVLIELPAIGALGETSVDGSMIFGITAAGSGTDNTLASSTPVLAVPDVSSASAPAGAFFATFQGASGLQGFFDSGSSVYFFADNNLSTCDGGFFCPTSTQNLTANVTGVNGSGGQIEFNIGNPNALFRNGINAFNDIGAALSGISQVGALDLGLPFFYGKTIYTGFENQTTIGPAGPFFACSAAP
jgi:hypothetical protein